MWVFSQWRPFLLENNDGLSLAGQYAGRGHIGDSTSQEIGRKSKKIKIKAGRKEYNNRRLTKN